MLRTTFVRASAGAATAIAVSGRARAQSLGSMKIGAIPVDVTSEGYVAASGGYFSRHGLSVEVQTVTNGAASAAALLAGSLDAGAINIISLASAHSRSIPLKIIAGGALYVSSASTSAIIVGKDAPIRSAKDLNGKTFAINSLRGLGQIAVQAWVDKNGGDSKSLHFVELPVSSMGAAVESQRVDAAFVEEPGIAQSRAFARVLASAYDGIGNRWMLDAWVATESWVSANPDRARAFGAAVEEAASYANRNRPKTAAMLVSDMKMDPAVVAVMQRASFSEHLDARLIQPPIDLAARYGVIPASFPAKELLAFS